MDTTSELYQAALLMHGHRCPAMPLGLRAGLAALEALGTERSRNGELRALVEIDRSHCGTCFADGIQMATGCTFGKGNIERLGYGKFAVTLIDYRSAQSVRVLARPEVIRRSQESEFIAERRRGVPACQIDPRLSEDLIRMVLAQPVSELFNVGPVMKVELPPPEPHAFDTFICDLCGETVVTRYAREREGLTVCIPCAEAGAEGRPVPLPVQEGPSG